VRETLYIRLRQPQAGVPTSYAVVLADPAAAVAGVPPSVFVRELPLEQIVGLAAGRKLVVFVPGAEVRLTQVQVPARQPAKVLQAAPFVLEDQLAEDIETLHFALGPRQADGVFPVAVVSHAHMEEWLAPFRAQGVMPDQLVPETLALPWDQSGPWSVLPESSAGGCTVIGFPVLGLPSGPIVVVVMVWLPSGLVTTCVLALPGALGLSLGLVDVVLYE